MIYLNNAGTSWPKPKEIAQAMTRFTELDPSQWDQVFEEGLEIVTTFFGIKNPDRFLFTSSCTQSLSIAFSDFDWAANDRLLISSLEHHALSRWFHKLQAERGVIGTVIPRSSDGPLDLGFLEEELKKGVRMVALTMASNVTGEVMPFEKVVSLCKRYNTFCLLDGAQTAGVIPIDLKDLDPDVFVFAGHKGPLGPQGIGGLYVSERLPMICPTASCDFVPGQDKIKPFPSYCDTGSAPMINVAGLTAGLKWLQRNNSNHLIATRRELVATLRNRLSNIPELQVLGSNDAGVYTGAVAIACRNISPTALAQKLWKEHEIKVGVGFQCAPLAHESLGTADTGVVRLSIGYFNTEEEIDFTIRTLVQLQQSL